MKITIFGLAGTGTSTLAKRLAGRLNYEFKSTGNMFRDQARRLGLSINQLDELSQADDRYDLALDQDIAEYGRNHDNFVIDSRLAWHFVPDSLKIKLTCADDVRFDRIAKRDRISPARARAETIAREAAIADRYRRYYNLADFAADANFDLVIDSGRYNVKQELDLIDRQLKF